MLFNYSKRNHKKYHVEDLGTDMFFIWLGWINKFFFFYWINYELIYLAWMNEKFITKSKQKNT